MALRFRFRTVPFLAAVAAAALGIALGNWQTGRAEEKMAIEARIERRDQLAPLDLARSLPSLDEIEYRSVRARGNFVPGWNVFLDNRPYDGAAGFYVLASFRLDSGEHLLVKRGWIARDTADRIRIPEVFTPPGKVQIEGTVRRDVGKTLQLGTPEPLQPRAIVQNADIAQFADAGGWQMLPFVLEQTSDTGDRLVRDWPRPSSGADKHRGYAFQWYGLAAAALIFFFATGFTRESTNKRD